MCPSYDGEEDLLEEETYVSVKQVARTLNVHPSTISRAIKAGEYPCYRTQNTVRLKWSEVKKAITQHAKERALVGTDDEEHGMANLFKDHAGNMIKALNIRWFATFQSFPLQTKDMEDELPKAEKSIDLVSYINTNHELKSFKIMIPPQYREKIKRVETSIGVEKFIRNDIFPKITRSDKFEFVVGFALDTIPASVVLYDKKLAKYFPAPHPSQKIKESPNLGSIFTAVYEVDVEELVVPVVDEFDRVFDKIDGDNLLIWQSTGKR